MDTRGGETGFTIVEVIVATVIIGLFAGLFFQSFFSNTAQQTFVVQRAAADDIALNNLKKITGHDSPLITSLACSEAASSNPNNLTKNANAPGSEIASVNFGQTPAASQYAKEPTEGTSLPPGSGTTQKMVALYPRGCSPAGIAPITIKSTVTFSTPHGTETVTRAIYIN